MDLNLAFPGSATNGFALAGWIFVALKLIATVLQILLARGDYRRAHHTSLFQAIYLTGKVTPALAAVCFSVSAILRHDYRHGWIYGLFAVFVAFLAVWVVRLRKQGRFFGVLGMLARKHV